jgi:hypothetical protein
MRPGPSISSRGPEMLTHVRINHLNLLKGEVDTLLLGHFRDPTWVQANRKTNRYDPTSDPRPNDLFDADLSCLGSFAQD